MKTDHEADGLERKEKENRKFNIFYVEHSEKEWLY